MHRKPADQADISDPLEMAKKLISIPSYVDDYTDEAELGEYVYRYLKRFKYLDVRKQKVDGGRFNIIATDGSRPKLAFFCHLDTVPPSSDWNEEPFKGTVKRGRLYGLGAVDMKGGTASLLTALAEFKRTKGLYLVFNVDEEYYFKGMTSFIRSNKISPELALFPEPTESQIRNGHRGVIEIEFLVKGIAAHSHSPENGKSAIMGTINAVNYVNSKLNAMVDASLGRTTCNLAYIKGGMSKKGPGVNNYSIVERGNKIPDITKAVLELRPSKKEINAKKVIGMLKSNLNANGFKLIYAKTKLDRGRLLISKDKLTKFESVIAKSIGKARYSDIEKTGYGEGQMLNEAFGTSIVYFGPSPYAAAHKSDECVSIPDLYKMKKAYADLIKAYCK